jgi:FKBP-type peptidyl-prolyl cis-trans isomerase FkpA
MLKKFLLGLILIASLSGCLKSSEGTYTCTYDPCGRKAPASEITAVQNYLSSKSITNAIQHCSGLFYVIENPGTGQNPSVCSNIGVTYEGKLADGTVFDATTSEVAFNLGQVITGWQNALPLIKAGGRIHIYIPPSLAYGSSGAGTIPPNSILEFTVDLIHVQ